MPRVVTTEQTARELGVVSDQILGCRPDHWLHLKTSNPIESSFASIRRRTRVAKGPGSKAAGSAKACKLLAAAQGRWRAGNGPHLVALVHAGARFDTGTLVERPPVDAGTVAA